MKRRNILITLSVVFSALALWGASETLYNFKGHYYGIFLLTGRDNHRWVLKDDLFLGDGPRVIFALSFAPLRRLFYPRNETTSNSARLEVEWDAKNGNGWVRNVLGNGTELRTYFSRFEDSENYITQGLFVGGGEATDVQSVVNKDLNSTGMTFFDGQRWLHLWCNANEGIRAADPRQRIVPPSYWRFIDSKVLLNDSERLVLRSRHEVVIDNVPLRIERFAYFRAGAPFFKLGINITNVGNRAVSYFYFYGDEPWVGEFGSSLGNLGWAKGRILPVETTIDPQHETYAGMVDVNHQIANFIEWFGSYRPNLVYISNENGRFSPAGVIEPLVSNERFIGLEWGSKTLLPGETSHIYLALGMAAIDSKMGIPIKPPDIPLSDYLLSRAAAADPP